jgi:hypothetical protein
MKPEETPSPERQPGTPLPLVERRRNSGQGTRDLILIAAVVALALGTLPSLASGILFANAARNDILKRNVDGCQRNNDVRITVQKIMRGQEPLLADYLSKGEISQERYDQTLQLIRSNIALMAPIDCERVIRR